MKTKILCLCPMKSNLHPELKLICRENMQRLVEGHPDFEITAIIDERGDGDGAVKNHIQRVQHTAAIRQGMIDDHLKDHDFVLWWDADLTVIPNDIISQMFSYCPAREKTILAPWVFIEKTTKFYDTCGFIYLDHDGKERKMEHHHPYIRKGMAEGRYAYEMEGVGCCCIIPASVYKLGAKHEPSKERPGYTDWYVVCQFAKKHGYDVMSLPNVKVAHANLHYWGEGWHALILPILMGAYWLIGGWH